jgi:hypothetical protein
MAKKSNKEAKTSLERMYEVLGPYLPKTNLEEADPGRDWSVEDCSDCSHVESSNHTKAEGILSIR